MALWILVVIPWIIHVVHHERECMVWIFIFLVITKKFCPLNEVDIEKSVFVVIVVSFRPIEIATRAHRALGQSRDMWPIPKPLKESSNLIQVLSSSSSWKIRDRVCCKCPYLQAKSTFEPNGYSSGVD